MFNEADFVISILNSEDENVKKNVDKMCGLSSDDKQTDINYGLFNSEVRPLKSFFDLHQSFFLLICVCLRNFQKQLDYMQHLQT